MHQSVSAIETDRAGMVRVPGGTFLHGIRPSTILRRRRAHRRDGRARSGWIAHAVTNEEFRSLRRGDRTRHAGRTPTEGRSRLSGREARNCWFPPSVDIPENAKGRVDLANALQLVALTWPGANWRTR